MEEVVRRTSEEIFIPFTVGGGVAEAKDYLLSKGVAVRS